MMKHLTPYGKFTDVHYTLYERVSKETRIFESTELDLKEILLELKDLGYTIAHDDAIRGPGYDALNRMNSDIDNYNLDKSGIGLKSIWIKDNIKPSDWVELPWSELKEYALRIKDYLGDKFVSFQWRKILAFKTKKGTNPYKTVELNDETEIDDRVWSFVIMYKE